MAGTPKRLFGPVALTATLTTNVYNNSDALIYDVITQIHVVNKTASPANFTLYLGLTGGTAAGTECFFQQNVAADSVYDWYGRLVMTSTDFLVGGADGLVHLVITGLGDRYVA